MSSVDLMSSVDDQATTPAAMQTGTAARKRAVQRNVSKPKFVSLVKASTRPGRPAYAELARELSAMLGVQIILISPRECVNKTCGKVFMPTQRHQTHCSPACSNADRQRSHRERVKQQKAKAESATE